LGRVLNLSDFYVEGKRATWQYHKKHRDISFIVLEKAVNPGDMTMISASFSIQIPESFSRFGHEGQSYQITQWFPKPAVYDQNGWHPMPYLDLGEFYSEFGDYDVTITLPENYYVAATGELLSQSELERINKRVAYSENIKEDEAKSLNNEFPKSSESLKSIRFIAEDVHDFAWFADKRYMIKEKNIMLSAGNAVKGQIFYLPKNNRYWKNALDYVERGLTFYSEKVGAYPYPKVAAVEGALKAGGGMEYPMVTVIGEGSSGKDLDIVITHEIGHNWFYGILGFDERTYPWLDEGINSYYDHSYSHHNYKSDRFKTLPNLFKQFATADLYSTYHDMATRKAVVQPSSLSSTEFTMYNYLLGAYQNPARAFNYLAHYLGEDHFDQIMKSFYTKWAFRHPGPEDLKYHFEKESAKDLSWFFDGMIADTRAFDYALKNVEQIDKGYQLKIRNNTDHAIPVQISGLSDQKVVYSEWIEGFSGDSLILVEKDSIDRFVLDHNQLYSDIDRQNNTKKTTFSLFSRKPSLRFFNIVEDPMRSQHSWLPSIGWNKSDGLMLGLMLFNHTVPQNRFQYFIHPMVSFRGDENSDWLTGQGKITYDWFRNDALRNIKLSLFAKSFHFDLPNTKKLRYIKTQMELMMRFNEDLSNRISYDLIFAGNQISTERSWYPEGISPEQDGFIGSLKFKRNDKHIMLPMSYQLTLEYGSFDDFLVGGFDQYLQLSAEFATHFKYAQKKKIDVRFYGGTNLWRNYPKSTFTRHGTLGLIGYAMNDYLYDDYFFDRGTQDGYWSNQINMTEGGFKTAVSSAYNMGQSNKYVASMNLKADLPFDIPVLNSFKPFVDLGVYGYLPTISDGYENKFLYSAGIMFESYEGVFNLYLPLFNSEEITNIYKEDGKFINRISFSMNLKLFDITKLLDREDLLYGQ